MDKAYEKIIELKEELKLLYIEKNNIKDKKDAKISEIKECYKEKSILKAEKHELDSDKVDLQYKLSNIKKWKRNTILKTILGVLCCISMIALLNSKINIPTLLNLILISITVPTAILTGESGNYYWNRKYLKTHKLDDIENRLEENIKNYSLNNDKIVILESELTELITELNELSNKINLTEDEIEKLNSLRIESINEYLTNNLEFDNLVNKKYELQKTLTKKV